MDEPRQTELTLPFPELSGDMPLLPARMVNEYQYCPRLAYLEWVQGEWRESADTVEGRYQHRRVDQRKGDLPAAGEVDEDTTIHAKSITLSSNKLGLIARLDLIEAEEGRVIPVDYKRGKRPHVAKGVYDPERVQLCVQGMLLEEHGYVCEEGAIYYVAGRDRVRVVFDDELRAMTINAISGLRLIAAGGRMPAPLEDSPKCPKCSLVSICLPDEVHYLQSQKIEPRPLAVMRDEALPVYVQAHSAKVAKKGEVLEIYVNDEKVQTARIIDTSQLVLMGNVYVTTPCLQDLMKREIPITWHSYSGWFFGHSQGAGHKNVELRTAQYKASFNEKLCLRLSKIFVETKILNCRTFLGRNWRGPDKPVDLRNQLKQSANSVKRAADLQQLLGIEGAAASVYFGAFSNLIRQPDPERALAFDFTTRNRRPPTDPVNALLSFAYTLLVRSWTVTLSAVGFDPYRGFYHQPRYGRPALALDLMESFRPLIADSCVVQAINNGEVRPSDFVSAAGAVNLTADGRKRFIGVFERRMSHEVTHPLFGYKVSYRRLLELQARLLGRFLLGEIPDYPDFRTR